MLRKRQCEIAAAMPVATLARFTVVDTAAGEMPAAQQDAGARRPEPHAERPVDQRGRESGDGDERQLPTIHSIDTIGVVDNAAGRRGYLAWQVFW